MSLIRNVVAVIIGLFIGSAINMAFIIIGPTIIPPPTGVDVTDMESLTQNMHLFEAKHFLFPFIAHALGTFVGAMAAIKIGKGHALVLAGAVTLAFFAGGVFNIVNLPAPVWFEAIDIIFAYIPMGWLALKLVGDQRGVES